MTAGGGGRGSMGGHVTADGSGVTNGAKFKVWLNSITGVVFIAFGSKLALMKNG